MKSFAVLACAVTLVTAGAVIPYSEDVTTIVNTVTVTLCETAPATGVPTPTYGIKASIPSHAGTADSKPEAVLGPVSNPKCDPSDLRNIVPKSNLTVFYGSSDPSTPDTNAEISVQMRIPSVLLEDISSIKNVVCSDTGLVVTFSDVAGFEKSVKEWPSNDFVLFTNHLGNCDAEYERGLFLVDDLAFDKATLTVIATVEKSDFQSLAGSMQIDFGQAIPASPSHSGSPFSNSTDVSKRNIVWDPTYTLNFNKALNPDTVIASVGSYVSVVANTASFTSSASFRGHLDYDFWKVKVKQLYFDVDVGFDANLKLTGDVNGAYQNNFNYAPSALTVAPINIPGILTLGPALNFAVGVQIAASADVTITTETQVKLANGNAHVDLLDQKNTGTSGWTPTYSASATADANALIQLDPNVQLGVSLAVNFLGGLLDLSSGLKANATLTNQLAIAAGVSADTSNGVRIPTGTINGVCQNGAQYKSDFYFGITGYVTQFYSAVLYSVKVPVFDKCWTWAKSS